MPHKYENSYCSRIVKLSMDPAARLDGQGSIMGALEILGNALDDIRLELDKIRKEIRRLKAKEGKE